jgi:hypothetical protein
LRAMSDDDREKLKASKIQNRGQHHPGGAHGTGLRARRAR